MSLKLLFMQSLTSLCHYKRLTCSDSQFKDNITEHHSLHKICLSYWSIKYTNGIHGLGTNIFQYSQYVAILNIQSWRATDVIYDKLSWAMNCIMAVCSPPWSLHITQFHSHCCRNMAGLTCYHSIKGPTMHHSVWKRYFCALYLVYEFPQLL